jgi:type I restriction enzyme M protein
MTSPLTVTRNDYHTRKKNSTVYTPVGVARFLFDILWPAMHRRGLRFGKTVFDPSIGSGRLTDPWFYAGSYILGCDLDISLDPHCHGNWEGKFEQLVWPSAWPKPDLVLCNPPFNGATGKRLYPEVFLEHVFELFGKDISVVLFVPMGFRLNQRRKSKRWRWLRDCEAKITSIISLPLDIFEGVEFHNEVLIFNVSGLEPHYFLPETYL